MACGVPVVTTDVGIIPEILGGGAAALLVPAGSVEKLTEMLVYWLQQSSGPGALGERLRERVLTCYGPAPSVDQYENILSELASLRALVREE